MFKLNKKKKSFNFNNTDIASNESLEFLDNETNQIDLNSNNDNTINFNTFFSSLYKNEINKRINGIKKDVLFEDKNTRQNNNTSNNILTDINFSSIKNDLNSRGYIFKPYIRKNTYEYYSSQYFFINKLFLDTFIIMYFLFLIETFVTFFTSYKVLNMNYKIFILFVLSVSLIPFYYYIKYLMNKNKKTRIKTIFKYSIVNSLILMLDALLIIMLIAFFGVGINSSNKILKIKVVLLPALFTLNIPLTSLVLTILSKNKKYYVV